MQYSKKQRKIHLISSFIIGMSTILILIITSKTKFRDINTICLWILSGCYLVAFNYFGFWNYVVRKWKKSKNKREIIVNIIMIMLILFVFLPFKYNNVIDNNYFLDNYLDNQKIDIIPLGEKNEQSLGYQIWLEGIREDDKDYNLYNLVLTDGWEYVEERPFTDGMQTGALSFTLNADSSYDIMIRRGPNAGKAEIRIGGKSSIFDFYQKVDEQRAVIDIKKIILQNGGYNGSFVEKLIYNFAFIEIIAEISAVISVWYVSFVEKEKKLKEKEVKFNVRESKRDT